MLTYDQARPGAVLRARELRRNSTDAERKLWRALREGLPAYKWRRQMPVGPYFADFACFAEKLIIEVDGGQHAFSSSDAARTEFLQAQGFDVLRFWNNDVLSNVEGVLAKVSLSLGKGTEQHELRDFSPRTPSPNPLPRGEGIPEYP